MKKYIIGFITIAFGVLVIAGAVRLFQDQKPFGNTYQQIQNQWLKPYHWSFATTNQTSTATSTVYAEEINIPTSLFACGIGFVTGAATDTGNIIVGIYGPSTVDNATSSALVVQATSSETAASINSGQTITIPTTLLSVGQYYLAIHFQSTSTQFQRNSNQTQVVGWTQTFVNSTSSQNLPPLPGTLSNATSGLPGLQLKVCSG